MAVEKTAPAADSTCITSTQKCPKDEGEPDDDEDGQLRLAHAVTL